MIDFKDLDFDLFWCDNDYLMSLLFRNENQTKLKKIKGLNEA